MPVKDKGVAPVTVDRNRITVTHKVVAMETGKKVISKKAGAFEAPGKFVSVTGKGVVSSKVRDYSSDPFFAKKAADAKAETDRVGLPGSKN